MDNICHTLVGAALGEAGLKARTRFGNPALMIAANLPDLDVLVFATNTPSASFRRGWTHGLLAQALLPLAFAALLMLWDWWRPRREGAGPPARWGALILIGYAGVLSHVLLDYLNNYGVRILMPFSDRWFYGDSLFIVDVWLLLLLGGGVYLARRRQRPVLARRALALSTLYVVVMFVSARAATSMVRDAWVAVHGSAPARLMVGPLPITPLSKAIIVDAGDHFETGTFWWIPPTIRLDAAPLPKRAGDPAVQQARDTPAIRVLLAWSRFPYFDVAPAPGGTLVTFTDLRFGARVGQTTIFVPR